MTNHRKVELSFRKPILQAMQNWFGKTYDVGTGILDEQVRPLTFETNHRNYCITIRLTPKGIYRCRLSDARLVRECKRTRDIVWHVCDNGLLDFAVPIMKGNHPIAYFFGGQLRGAFGGIRTNGGHTFLEKIVSDLGVASKDRKATTKGLYTEFTRLKVRNPEQLFEINQAARRFARLLSWIITTMAQWEPDSDVLRTYLQKAVHAATVNELLDISIKFLPKIIGAKQCSIFLVGQDVEYGERLILRKTSYRSLKPMENSGFYTKEEGEGLTGWVWRTGRSLRLQNASDEAELAAVDPNDRPVPSGRLKDSKHLREFLCVPILDRAKQVAGVLRTPTKRGGFTLDDEIALLTLGEYLYSLIESCGSREREADVKKALDMALNFQRCVTEEDVWNKITSSAMSFWGKSKKTYLLNIIDEDQHLFTIKSISGELNLKSVYKRKKSYKLKRTTTGYIVRKRTSILIQDLDKASRLGRYLPAVRGGRSLIAAPVFTNKTIANAVMAVIAKEQYAFSQKDESLLGQLCQCAAEALERIQDRSKAAEYEKLMALSRLLTGLRHDLGTPMEQIDVYLREQPKENKDISLLSDFILTGLGAYQFVPAVSGKDEFLGLEQSLIQRVKRRRATSFSIRPIIENCIKVLDMSFTSLPKCRIRCSDKYSMKADCQLLTLVIYNLIKNSRQHADKKGQDNQYIVISVRRRNKMTHIEVSDRNKPIRKEACQSLFQFRSSSDNGTHLGAGLALARLFVQAHPGPSKKGRGVISYSSYKGRNIFRIVIRG